MIGQMSNTRKEVENGPGLISALSGNLRMICRFFKQRAYVYVGFIKSWRQGLGGCE